MKPLILSALSLFIAVPWTTNLTAQLVQVGPGYVRAPFVRVYTNPDGSTHVRAPFVSVNSPARYYAVPPQPVFAPPYEARPRRLVLSPGRQSSYRDLNWRQLRQLARDSLVRLETSLQPSWRKYLQIDQLAEIVAYDMNEPLDEQQITQLTEALRSFEATLNSSNARVTGAAGFRDLYGALVQLSYTPEQRMVEQLLTAKRQLDQDLERIKAPSSWLDYLRLPITADNESSDIPEAPVAGDNVARMAATLQRYDQTATNEQYHQIADLSGFQSTRSRLREYIEFVQQSAAPSILRSVEQLPLPEPDDADSIDSPSDNLDLGPPANLDSLEPVPEVPE